MASEEKKNDESEKGFAGLSSMVSDVDDITTNVQTSNPEPLIDTVSIGQTKNQSASESKSTSEPYQQPQKTSGIGGLVVISAFIFFGWLIVNSSNNSNKIIPTTNSSSSSVDSSTHAVNKSKQATSEPSIPIRPSEVKPPVGTNLNLSVAQIRYCMAEDIRLDGAKQSLNNYIGFDVDIFNEMVSDYNSRCGHFLYRVGALDTAKSEVEVYRKALIAEGRSRFALPSSSVDQRSILNSTPKYTPQTLIMHMLEYALNDGGLSKESEIQQLKLQIESLPKPVKGKKKAAREFNDKGLVLSNEGDFSNAVKLFEEAYELDKSDIEVVSNLGYAYLKQGSLDLSQQATITSLTLSPGRATSWNNLANVFGIKGDISKAVACFSNTYRFSKDRLKTHQFLKKLNENEDVDSLKQARAQAIVWAEKSYPELADWKQPLPITGQINDAKVAVKESSPLDDIPPLGLQSQPSSTTPSDLVKPTLTGASPSEQQAIENSCDIYRRTSGPATYYDCLNREVNALGASQGKPNLSGMSDIEKKAIENVCDIHRRASGPATYYDCLNREVNALKKV